MTAERVVLRRWRAQPRTVIALFPDQDWGEGLIGSYEHIGQHGGASRAIVSRTSLVRHGDPDGADLLAELRQIGYEPVQLLRLPPAAPSWARWVRAQAER